MSLFTSDFVKRMWKIKKSLNCSHKVAYHLAKEVVSDNLDSSTSLIGIWSHTSTVAVAGHFYGLHKAYAAKRDNGRSFYFGRVAKRIYACLDAGAEYSLRDFMISNKHDSSAMTELLDFYLAAYEGRPTSRQMTIAQYDQSYTRVAHLPTWQF